MLARNGHAWRSILMAATIQTDRVLSDLSELWVSLAKQHDGKSDGVLRACAMTLIVLAPAEEDKNEIGETLAALMRDHPSRTIVVRLREATEPELDASVFAQCWMPFGQRRQICCEQIEITASRASLSDVPGVLMPLLAPDLPVFHLSRQPGLLGSSALKSLSGIAGKTIVDTAALPDSAAALRTLYAMAPGVLTADLAWTRLTRWREVFAQIFENPVYAACLPSIALKRIYHSSGAAPVSARYFEAWLRQCLDKSGAKPRFEREQTGDANSGISRIELSSECPEPLNVSLRRIGDSIAEVGVNELLNRTVFPVPSDYSLLREELSIPGDDSIFEAALARAVEARRCKVSAQWSSYG